MGISFRIFKEYDTESDSSEEERKAEVRDKELYIPQKDPAELIFDNGVNSMNDFLNKVQKFE
ncbi:MAG: hypothetical protein RI883_2656 [Bacteroidota bacterium]|jgi:hypothetical protein